jgi:formylglycine-generating enzyme required for sulfatase activity
MKIIIYNNYIKDLFKVFCVAFLLPVFGSPVLAQEQRQDPDQEQPEEEDRRVRRLRDSLATDSNADWVPGQTTGASVETLARKLRMGQKALDSGNLLQPPNANALGYYGEALEIDPQNQEASDGITRIAEQLVARAQTAQGNNDRSGALALIQQVKAFRPNHPGLSQLESEISRSGEIEVLLGQADQYLGSGQLDAPPDGNALQSYRAVLDIDPANDRAAEGLRQIEAGMIARAAVARGNNDFNAASALLDAAALINGGSDGIEQARSELIASRDELWASRIEDINANVEANSLDAAEQALDDLVASGYQGDEVEVARARIAERALLLQYQAGSTFSDDRGPVVVVIGTGQFTMGSASREDGRSDNEGPQQQIEFLRPFGMTQTEVTVAQFREFVEATNYQSDAEKNGQSTVYDVVAGTLKKEDGVSWRDNFQGRDAQDQFPVVHVSWNDAVAYARWLSEQTGAHYRLPSESEFEYALKAGTTSPYWWGTERVREKVENLTGDGDKIADRWEWPNPFERYRDGHWGPSPVSTYVTNPFGLFDIGGNAMEWASDCYRDTLEGISANGAPRIIPDCTLHVLKGGSWASPPRMARSAYRSSAQATRSSCLIGFRLVRDL